MAQAGRGRGKIAHEHTEVLKTKGDHIAQHFGPGQTSLAAFLLRLKVLAFVWPPVWQGGEDKEAVRRQVLASRPTGCDDLRALPCSRGFESGHHVMDFMLRGLARDSKLDTG
jgi:hypothetical protein